MKTVFRIALPLMLALLFTACDGTPPINEISRDVSPDEYYAILDAISAEAAALPDALPTTAPETTAAPETAALHEGDEGGELVWVPTKGGTKYHSRPDCSGMAEPVQVARVKAEQDGYTACKRCHK